MENRVKNISEMMQIVSQLKPFVQDENEYDQLHANFHDLLEANDWLLNEMSRERGGALTADEAESFLIDLDVRYIKHVMPHLTSLRKNVAKMLAKLGDMELE